MELAIVFDPEKDAENVAKHSISLGRATDFDFLTSLTDIDDAQDYGEVRYIAIGFLDAMLHVLVFTEEINNTIRAISLRKAVKSEMKVYVENQ